MSFMLLRRQGFVLQAFYNKFTSKVISCSVSKSPGVAASVLRPYQQSRCVVTIIVKKPPELSTAYSPSKAPLPKTSSRNVPRERFIPITRRSVVRHLMEEENFLTEEELKKYESFTLSLDSAILNKYHKVLQELKFLFDPINPDKDTVITRKLNRRERLDNEFWLIQKLSAILEKANFRELPRSEIERALSEHQARDGVMVSVDVNKYDVLRYWSLGRETPVEPPAFIQKVIARIVKQKPQPKAGVEYYKCVIVAVRLKRDDKLILKAFKEVPVNALEQLLPDGKVKMRRFDRTMMMAATAAASAGVLAKMVTHLAGMPSDWMLMVTGVAGIVAFNGWRSYKKRHNAYLLDLNRTLYFKIIANNSGLLSLLVDRAEDEMFKECLLTYTFLLTNRPPSAQTKHSSNQHSEELGSMSKTQLEEQIQDWLYRKTNERIDFQADEAITLLSDFGILSQDSESNLHVVPLNGATKNLPITVQTLALPREDHDLTEGYEKDMIQDADEEYKEEDVKRRSFGWF